MSRPLIAGRINPNADSWEITLELYIDSRLYRNTTHRASPSTADWALAHFRKKKRFVFGGAMVEALREFADYIDHYQTIDKQIDMRRSFDRCWRD